MSCVSVILILQVRNRSASAGVRIRPSRPDTAVQVTVPPLRLLVPDTDASRCRLPRRTGGVGRTESHGRVQPAAGVPPPAPGRGKLRREAGRRKAASGAVMLQQKRGCLRSLTEFGAATQRLCFQQRKNCLFFFGRCGGVSALGVCAGHRGRPMIQYAVSVRG